MDFAGIGGKIALFFTRYTAVILSIILIIILAIVGIRLVAHFQRRFEQNIDKRSIEGGQKARLVTVERAVGNTAIVVIIAIAVLMILLALNINITPLLASVGVAGLAVSLGAQTLIKDFIGGVLILFENQFNVGDDIEVDIVTGTVERIELRATYVRDIQGKLFIVPNGDIRILSNNSRDWRKVVVDLNIAFDADINQAVQALRLAMQRADSDEILKADLLEQPVIQGWNSMNEWSVQVRLSAKTLPNKQTTVAAALREYALKALQEANIPLATPQPWRASEGLD